MSDANVDEIPVTLTFMGRRFEIPPKSRVLIDLVAKTVEVRTANANPGLKVGLADGEEIDDAAFLQGIKIPSQPHVSEGYEIPASAVTIYVRA